MEGRAAHQKQKSVQHGRGQRLAERSGDRHRPQGAALMAAHILLEACVEGIVSKRGSAARIWPAALWRSIEQRGVGRPRKDKEALSSGPGSGGRGGQGELDEKVGD